MGKKTSCLQCGSHSTKRCQMVYEQGLRTNKHGESWLTSELAARCAPPAAPDTTPLASKVISGLAAAGTALWLASKFDALSDFTNSANLVIMAVTSVPAAMAYAMAFAVCRMLIPQKALSAEYQQAMQEWQQQWVCLDCGDIARH